MESAETQRLLDGDDDFACVQQTLSLTDDAMVTSDLDDTSTVPQVSHRGALDAGDSTLVFPTSDDPAVRPWRGTERCAWFFRFATPLDDLLVATGLGAAVTTGVLVAWAPFVAVEALAALSATTVDTTAAVGAARRMLWIACSVFVLRVVYALALNKAATRQLRHLYTETAHRAMSLGASMPVQDTNGPWILGPNSTDTAVLLQRGLGSSLGEFVRHATQIATALAVILSHRGGLLSVVLLAHPVPSGGTMIVGYLLRALYFHIGGITDPSTPKQPMTPRENDWQAQKSTVITRVIKQMRAVATLNARVQCIALATAFWRDMETEVVAAPVAIVDASDYPRKAPSSHQFVGLVQRLIHPESGEITLDGVDINELNSHWLRQQIAVIERNPVLFGGLTLSQNIATGTANVTHAQVIDAAKTANIHDLITSLPQGYNTPVGDVSLTLELRLLLVITRAITRDPAVLIFDHVVGSSSRNIVQTTVDALLKTSTATRLVLTDRAHSCGNVDNIVVVAAGRIVEQGTRVELMRIEDGAFAAKYHREESEGPVFHNQEAAVVSVDVHSWKKQMRKDQSMTSQVPSDLEQLNAIASPTISRRFVSSFAGVLLLGFAVQYAFVCTEAKSSTYTLQTQLRALCRRDIEYFDKLQVPASHIANSMYAGADHVAKVFGSIPSVILICVSVSSAATLNAIMSTGDSTFGLAFLIVLAWRTAMGCTINNPEQRISCDNEKSDVIDFIENADKTVSLGLETFATARYSDHADATLRSLGKCTPTPCIALLDAVDKFLAIGSCAFVLWYGVKLGLSMHDLSRAHTSLCIILVASNVITSLAPTYVQNIHAARKAIQSFETALGEAKNNIEGQSDAGLRPRIIKGKIEFRDVTFCDPKGSDSTLGLRHFTLLERFYDPTEGEVLMDDMNIKTLDVRSLRGAVGLVDHSPKLISGGHYVHNVTVADNITLGMDPPQRKVNVSCERRHNIGDRRRIALARSVVINPSVLVLDDLGSGLTDHVLDAKKRTTILIGHELAAARQADKIFVLDGGRVVEVGPHDELLTLGGVYAKLVASSTSSVDAA